MVKLLKIVVLPVFVVAILYLHLAFCQPLPNPFTYQVNYGSFRIIMQNVTSCLCTSRCKLSPKVLRDGILFGKRFTAQEALSNGLVDVITDADRLVDVSENLLSRVIGRSNWKREVISAMKINIYAINQPSKL